MSMLFWQWNRIYKTNLNIVTSLTVDKSNLYRNFHGNTAPKKNYYDILKIAPDASLAQIKEAYYKLSKLYHPDQNKNDIVATVRFREISEAYEELRKQDFSVMGTASPLENGYQFDDSKLRRPKPRSKGSEQLSNSFDIWYKDHYNEKLREKFKMKEEMKFRKINKEALGDDQGTFHVSLIVLIMLIFTIFGFGKSVEKNSVSRRKTN